MRRLPARRVPSLLRQSSDRTDPGRCLPLPARTKCPKATWRPGDIEGQVTAGERTAGRTSRSRAWSA